MELDGQKAQDARVEGLWRKLDTQNEGHLDIKGLKLGLNKMDHRKPPLIIIVVILNFVQALRNADDLLQDVLSAVDSDDDGLIQYNGIG